MNTLKVTADQQTIDEIAKRSDVAKVIPDRSFSLPPLQPNSGKISTAEWNLDNIHAPEVWDQFGARGDGIVIAQHRHRRAVRSPGAGSPVPRQPRRRRVRPQLQLVRPGERVRVRRRPRATTWSTARTRWARWSATTAAGTRSASRPARSGSRPRAARATRAPIRFAAGAGQWVLAPTDLNGQNPRPDLRPHVVNNSWGGGRPSDPFYQATVQAWVAAGIFPAFANGNAGPSCGSAGSPGDYPESYAVGAYDIGNIIAFFSSRGPGPRRRDQAEHRCAGRRTCAAACPATATTTSRGTSMATPHVAGIGRAALVGGAALVGDVAATRALLDQTAIDTERSQLRRHAREQQCLRARGASTSSPP